MGYEVQMLVGRVHENMKGYTEDTKDKGWFQIYATVDLCKPGNAKILEISGDGDTQIVEDKYGAPIVPIPIQYVLEALYADQRNDYYRRFGWAIALLESMVHEEDGQLSVAFWGF